MYTDIYVQECSMTLVHIPNSGFTRNQELFGQKLAHYAVDY